jgi:hypothetical protein
MWILLIILICLLVITGGPALGIAISRFGWVVLFILVFVALILVLLPIIGSGSGLSIK